jgi:hypothetical protein
MDEMDLLPMAMIMSSRASGRLMDSALPDAPQVPHRPRSPHPSRVNRTRATTARLLTRAADLVAPSPAVTRCDPTR